MVLTFLTLLPNYTLTKFKKQANDINFRERNTLTSCFKSSWTGGGSSDGNLLWRSKLKAFTDFLLACGSASTSWYLPGWAVKLNDKNNQNYLRFVHMTHITHTTYRYEYNTSVKLEFHCGLASIFAFIKSNTSSTYLTDTSCSLRMKHQYSSTRFVVLG